MTDIDERALTAARAAIAADAAAPNATAGVAAIQVVIAAALRQVAVEAAEMMDAIAQVERTMRDVALKEQHPAMADMYGYRALAFDDAAGAIRARFGIEEPNNG